MIITTLQMDSTASVRCVHEGRMLAGEIPSLEHMELVCTCTVPGTEERASRYAFLLLQDMKDDSTTARDAFISAPMAIYHQSQVQQAPAQSVQAPPQQQTLAAIQSGSMATFTHPVASDGGGGPRRIVGLDMLAKAAHREGLPTFGTGIWAEDSLGGGATATASSSAALAQEIMVHAYVALVELGVADVGKTTNFL